MKWVRFSSTVSLISTLGFLALGNGNNAHVIQPWAQNHQAAPSAVSPTNQNSNVNSVGETNQVNANANPSVINPQTSGPNIKNANWEASNFPLYHDASYDQNQTIYQTDQQQMGELITKLNQNDLNWQNHFYNPKKTYQLFGQDYHILDRKNCIWYKGTYCNYQVAQNKTVLHTDYAKTVYVSLKNQSFNQTFPITQPYLDPNSWAVDLDQSSDDLHDVVDWRNSKDDQNLNIFNSMYFSLAPTNTQPFSSNKLSLWLKRDHYYDTSLPVYDQFSRALGDQHLAKPNLIGFSSIDQTYLTDQHFRTEQVGSYDILDPSETVLVREGWNNSYQPSVTIPTDNQGLYGSQYISYHVLNNDQEIVIHTLVPLIHDKQDYQISRIEPKDANNDDDIYYVNYDHIFQAQRPYFVQGYTIIPISFNYDYLKLHHINWTKLLKVSHPLSFQISYQVNDQHFSNSGYDINDFLHNVALRIPNLDLNATAKISNISLSFSFKDQDHFTKLGDGTNNFIIDGVDDDMFQLNEDNSLKNVNLTAIDHIKFDQVTARHFYPSQLLVWENIMPLFHFYHDQTEFNQHLGMEQLLHIHVFPNDQTGVLKLDYYDFLKQRQVYLTIDNMKKIVTNDTMPPLNISQPWSSIVQHHLVNQKWHQLFLSNDNYWDQNAQLVPDHINDLSDQITYHVNLKSFNNDNIAQQWRDVYQNWRLVVKNQYSIKPIMLTTKLNKSPMIYRDNHQRIWEDLLANNLNALKFGIEPWDFQINTTATTHELFVNLTLAKPNMEGTASYHFTYQPKAVDQLAASSISDKPLTSAQIQATSAKTTTSSSSSNNFVVNVWWIVSGVLGAILLVILIIYQWRKWQHKQRERYLLVEPDEPAPTN